MAEGKLKNTELAAFAGQMALVLKSGISALEGISIMRDDAENEADEKLLGAIYDSMIAQGYFAPALRETKVFPDYFTSMTEIGERTGNLDTVMKSLEDHYDREEQIRRSTRNAVFYPLILMAMMLAVIIVLLVRVMPVFNGVFESLGAEMTGLPAFFMSLGDGLRTYGLIFIVILIAVLAVIFIMYRTDAGREAFRKFGSHFRSARASRHAVAACRFAGALEMTLSAGLTPEEGMDLAISLNEDPDFGKQLEDCRTDMEGGKSFSAALYDHRIFSGIYSRMLSIGQKTGSTDQVMGEIADMYQDEIDGRLEKRLATLEPTLVIIMSVAVGAIMLSVMFPLLGLMSSL